MGIDPTLTSIFEKGKANPMERIEFVGKLLDRSSPATPGAWMSGFYGYDHVITDIMVLFRDTVLDLLKEPLELSRPASWEEMDRLEREERKRLSCPGEQRKETPFDDRYGSIRSDIILYPPGLHPLLFPVDGQNVFPHGKNCTPDQLCRQSTPQGLFKIVHPPVSSRSIVHLFQQVDELSLSCYLIGRGSPPIGRRWQFDSYGRDTFGDEESDSKWIFADHGEWEREQGDVKLRQFHEERAQYFKRF